MQKLLEFAKYNILQEKSEDGLIIAFSWTWYNGWYPLTAKPTKTLEMDCPMIEFFIILFIYLFIIYLVS